MDNTVKLPKSRIYSFDVLRILAVLGVIMIHVAATYVKKSDLQSVAFDWGNLFHGITRFAVPAFIMLSGALMLDENKKVTAKKSLKYACVMLVLLVIWSFVYAAFFYIIVPESKGNEISTEKFINGFVYGHYHLWYLYMIIGLYLMTPVLRTFVKKENKKVISYLLLLSVIICFTVKFANFFLMEYVVEKDWITPLVDKFNFSMMGVYLTYFIAGWYVVNIEIKKSRRIFIYVLGAIGAFLTVFINWFYAQQGKNVQKIFHFEDIVNVLFFGIAFFMFFYYALKNKKFRKTKGMLVGVSKLTFGVYLVHVIVLYYVNLYAEGIEDVFVRIMVEFAATTIISFAVCFVLSKLPLLKKLIKC